MGYKFFSTCGSENYFILIILDDNLVSEKKIICQMIFFTTLKISFGEGNGKPLQYSCLENPMDRAAWQATVHGVATSQT